MAPAGRLAAAKLGGALVPYLMDGPELQVWPGVERVWKGVGGCGRMWDGMGRWCRT